MSSTRQNPGDQDDTMALCAGGGGFLGEGGLRCRSFWLKNLRSCHYQQVDCRYVGTAT
jgi:hypothetical protein